MGREVTETWGNEEGLPEEAELVLFPEGEICSSAAWRSWGRWGQLSGQPAPSTCSHVGPDLIQEMNVRSPAAVT